ncbi:hypothetical protein HHUSO_G855 [Huso huso]|uniref:Uncharacterized protein n=1 Tax=Huso huso TaxID=61971 RepID=A0ABR1ACP2_HUSHU
MLVLLAAAWETTAVPSCSHVAIKPLRSDHGPKNHLALVDLPGSISDLQEEFQSHQPCIRNTNIDKDPGATITECKESWLKISKIKWTAFKNWITVAGKNNKAAGIDKGIRRQFDFF